MLSLILLVARWFSTVWFGIINTLLSSLCGVVPLRMLLPKKPGNVGGVGRLLVVAFALKNRELSSGASRSSRYRGIFWWYFLVGSGALGFCGSGIGALTDGISGVSGITCGG